MGGSIIEWNWIGNWLKLDWERIGTGSADWWRNAGLAPHWPSIVTGLGGWNGFPDWSRIGIGLADWWWIGGSVMDLQICPRFASNSWIGDGLTDWWWIGRLVMDWQIGPELALYWWIGLASDWCWISDEWWIGGGLSDSQRIGVMLVLDFWCLIDWSRIN